MVGAMGLTRKATCHSLMSAAPIDETDVREKLVAFDKRLDDCITNLASVQSQTALLPQMQQALKALVEAHK